MTHLKIAQALYEHLVALVNNGRIPINIQAPSAVGTVQDDPFDRWVAKHVSNVLPQLEIVHSGSLTTPDLLLRDRTDGEVLGLEIKKLIQLPNGKDPRGSTL